VDQVHIAASEQLPENSDVTTCEPSWSERWQFQDGLGLPDSSRVRSALAQLREAAAFADVCAKDIWEFAVEHHSLRRLGLTVSECRWLILKGLATHARDISTADADRRTFEPLCNLALPPGTCFVITPGGMAEIDGLLTAEAWPIPVRKPECGLSLAPGNGRVRKLAPTWDPDCQQLRVARTIVKQFRLPAPDQEVVLAAFQESQWPSRIEDPFAPKPNQDSKQRLHRTINALNGNQRRPSIRFLSDEKGEGVQWEFIHSQVNNNGRMRLGEAASTAKSQP
jgi:hypothetical protein